MQFDKPEYAAQYYALLAEYEIPADVFAAVEVWVHACYGRWGLARVEAQLWAWCWREYRAGRRRDWIPGRGDFERSQREWAS